MPNVQEDAVNPRTHAFVFAQCSGRKKGNSNVRTEAKKTDGSLPLIFHIRALKSRVFLGFPKRKDDGKPYTVPWLWRRESIHADWSSGPCGIATLSRHPDARRMHIRKMGRRQKLSRNAPP